MTITFDFSELVAINELLKTAPDQARGAAYGAGRDVGEKVKRGAQADAPQDRPWLSREGIRKKSWRDQRGSHTDIFTVQDDRGRNVGFYVEFGSEDTPPVPFLSQQMGWAAEEFPTEVVRRVDPFVKPKPEAGE